MVNVGDDRNVTKVLALFNWQIFKVCLGLGHENYFPSEASRYQALPLSNDLGITEANNSTARRYSTFGSAYGEINPYLHTYIKRFLNPTHLITLILWHAYDTFK
ncbi:unannotated protein [freshwater metagenome]|uniref:Unannotated protein n=1 Tax=freshwater metagenome TaxID=449393 RepID=A0A6J7BAP6_9ZZZZ